MQNDNYCKICKTLIYPTYNFCPTCGINLKNSNFDISIGKQIQVYLLSVLLPPLGLWPGIKYLNGNNSRAHKVGIIAIILTLFSFIFSIWLTVKIFSGIGKSVTSSQNQLQMLENY